MRLACPGSFRNRAAATGESAVIAAVRLMGEELGSIDPPAFQAGRHLAVVLEQIEAGCYEVRARLLLPLPEPRAWRIDYACD